MTVCNLLNKDMMLLPSQKSQIHQNQQQQNLAALAKPQLAHQWLVLLYKSNPLLTLHVFYISISRLAGG